MLKRGGIHSFISKCITICSTFLLVGIVLFNTSISAFAVQNWQSANDTVYRSANGYAHEELPYGLNTAVVQIRYAASKYLTLYFDKLSIYRQPDNFNVADRQYSNLTDYYYNIRQGIGSNITFDILSDSPIYFRTTYHSDGVFQSTIGDLSTKTVLSYSQTVSGSSALTEKSYSVYEFNGSLFDIVGETLDANYFSVYSNVFMVDFDLMEDEFGDTRLFYFPVPALGQDLPYTSGTIVGYEIEYYPTLEYLQNENIRAELITNWQKLNKIIESNNSILTELYSVNIYLSDILVYLNSIDHWSESIYSYLQSWLPLIDYHLFEIIDILNELKSGPEYDSSQGIGSNTEFGDSFGGLTQDTEIPDSDIGGVQSTLGNSFLFIRNTFDWINNQFNLGYVITFLLGMSFIAYVLGRVIKNKMNG